VHSANIAFKKCIDNFRNRDIKHAFKSKKLNAFREPTGGKLPDIGSHGKLLKYLPRDVRKWFKLNRSAVGNPRFGN
jgi:hypothetical protein